MKIALFRNVGGSSHFDSVFEHDVASRPHSDWVRVSEWVEVNFPPLPSHDLSTQLAVLDAELRAADERHAQRCTTLHARREALLAERAEPQLSVVKTASGERA